MSTYLGDTPIAGISTKIKYNAHNLLDFKWSDHEIDDISWLRADTFSWQSGNTYTEVYNLLSSSIQGATTATEQGVTFYICSNGLRIALADQETNVSTAYTNDGVAWYYILDTDNSRFKLPRTKFGFTGLRDTAGKYVDESLPDYVALCGYNGTTGEFRQKQVAYNYTSTQRQGSTSASSTAATSYGAQVNVLTYRPVQQRATQMYLYFYVGEYSQTAIEQTAGITSEQLNAKQDVCIHIIEEYVNGTSGYRIWSSGYCEQWGSFGTTWTGVQTKTVTFLKTFKDTNYIATGINSATTNQAIYFNGLKTVSSCTFGGVVNDNAQANWKVCGYLAQGQY